MSKMTKITKTIPYLWQKSLCYEEEGEGREPKGKGEEYWERRGQEREEKQQRLDESKQEICNTKQDWAIAILKWGSTWGCQESGTVREAEIKKARLKERIIIIFRLERPA